ncbi:MAG: quinol:electron acceptor oxidoreductase subunit ActD, partial [Gemmatimonadales bacterium]
MAAPPAMNPRTGVVGVFDTLDGALLALRELKSKGYANLTVYSPTPQHELDDVLDHGVSPVRVFTLVGALTGCAFGFFYA